MTTQTRPNILMQLDADKHASAFDAVVAVDSGVDRLLQYHGVTPADVRDLVHGAIFTRGPADLRHTAIFIGGASVSAGEALMAEVSKTFFGPMRVSLMMDANGANTTAAAAVVAAGRHLKLPDVTALVLAGTGPVGQRAARLLAGDGAKVRLASRDLARATATCDAIRETVGDVPVSACSTASDAELRESLDGCQLVVAAGAAGVQLLSADARQGCPTLEMVIDLNAVPPLGIQGVEVFDAAELRDGVLCYGAIGVGGTKMKIHKASLKSLFAANNVVLDADSIYELGKQLEAEK